MQLHFELGDPDAPRGHAILFAHAGNDPNRVLATYCIVLPIQFSIGKYLPPILSGQVPMEGLEEASAMSVVPIPPMLEDAPSLAALRQLAERRGDDLCDMGVVFISDERQRLAFAAEACQSYGQLYGESAQRWPEVTAQPAAGDVPLDDLDVDEVLAEMLSDRDKLAELARLTGQARYALDGRDDHLLREVTSSMRRLARSLPEKYRAEQLVEAALERSPTGPRLAELYLQRAYKLLDEDYASIPPIENEIRALREQRGDDTGGASATL